VTDNDKIITIDSASALKDLTTLPAYLLPETHLESARQDLYSCSYCGVGDSGCVTRSNKLSQNSTIALKEGCGVFKTQFHGEYTDFEAIINDQEHIKIITPVALASEGGTIKGELSINETTHNVTAREIDRERSPIGTLRSQTFIPYSTTSTISELNIKDTVSTKGCIKLKLSLMRQHSAFPIHITPSALDKDGRERISLTYKESIVRLAELLLEHTGKKAKTLIYACGQIDYFTIFAMQEVFRLLGIRNLTGNAEHCLNAGAVHNEMLTGQEGPFLTFNQGTTGAKRFYLFNGWNGFITHPPVFSEIVKREDFDAYLIEVMETESAQVLQKKLGDERVLLIRPRTDPLLALAIAHEILTEYKDAVNDRFIDLFSDQGTAKQYIKMALSTEFESASVAKRIAPEPEYEDRLIKGIKDIAYKLTQPDSVPINIPSVGLSQTSGVVAHCLWGNLLALLGKYGLNADGSPAGGTLRLPGQINAESEVQGLSRKYFMGRIPMDDAVEAARRMDLPDNAYDPVLHDSPRAALDYSDPTPGEKELFICFGTQFEANMMDRPRWLRKLQDPDTKLVVIDPIPDPFSVAHADLIIPSPPHPATTKVYQNGEWKLSLSVPNKQSAPETRSDVTIIYDVMAEITQQLEDNPELVTQHLHLKEHLHSGYLRKRFVAPSPTDDDSNNEATKKIASTINEEITIGRSESNKMVLPERDISRHHAVITCIDRTIPRFHLKDLNSFNGCYKNSEQVSEVDFGLDDTINFGDTTLSIDRLLLFFDLSNSENLKSNITETNNEGGLKRIDGEICRPQLWQRILNYMSNGSGPLYCRPEDSTGQVITWEDLISKGSIIYGGVGETRYRLDYNQPENIPFADIYRKPRKFTFFCPTEQDLEYPQGIILNSGRSALSADRERIRFASSTFNSGKATPIVGMPDINPLHVSPLLAKRMNLKTGDHVKIRSRHSEGALVLPVNVSDWMKGDTTYVSFHKSKAQIERKHYINTVTTHLSRCPYCAQTQVKASEVFLEKAGTVKLSLPSYETGTLAHQTSEWLHASEKKGKADIASLSSEADLPVWSGQSTPLYVTDIINETHDSFTFRFQGNPLCRFVYWPGQFCTLVLNIDGKKVLRSYTISSPPTRPYILEITIKRVPGGLVSNWLPDNLNIGDKVEIAGPKGKFCLTPEKIPERLLFISGGSGITPMMSMSRWLCDISADTNIKFLNSVRSPNDIVFDQEIQMLTSRYKMFEPIIITSTRTGGSGGWTGISGRINTDMINTLVPDLHERHIYLCGPPGYMDFVKSLLLELDFDQAHLHMESFGGLRTSTKNKQKPMLAKTNISIAPPFSTTIDTKTKIEVETVETFSVTFSRSEKTVESDANLPLLDLAEEQDIDLDYSCRSGSCGDCKVKLIKGEVEMESEEGLDTEEKSAGYILTCVGTPRSNCILDA